MQASESTFTKAEMEAAYAIHGSALCFFDADGNGPFSCTPGDYFWAGPDDTFEGELVIRTPETFVPLQS